MKTVLAWSGGEVVACVRVRARGVQQAVKRIREEHGRVRIEVCSDSSLKEEIDT